MRLDELNADVREFCERRDWGQYHTPKDLAIGLTTESSELLELFRFQDTDDQSDLLGDAESREDIEDELADILFFLLRFADLYDISLEAALERKLEKNSDRYPAKEYKGSNRKADN
ncbi:nucleotide pyrophosphohydrolase [Haladaptatus sp. DYSN1]|uniref:nucleotide pyrophosphohydrolase n=1 Tax=unclassified Haladaptatus TaxID=2622732 RepID=UPI0024063B76|nr:nucleotide pyrophosphohydrolase [Haladaptatus sp. DYSN1]